MEAASLAMLPAASATAEASSLDFSVTADANSLAFSVTWAVPGLKRVSVSLGVTLAMILSPPSGEWLRFPAPLSLAVGSAEELGSEREPIYRNRHAKR